MNKKNSKKVLAEQETSAGNSMAKLGKALRVHRHFSVSQGTYLI
jgi:hypothetical protein